MIARALVHRPRLLVLDEPTTGLDPQARMAVWDLVDGLRAEGLGVVLTTHYMDEAERLSDALTVLAQGRVVAHGAPTGCASPTLHLAIQVWTTRGFAVLDVDYRGSTGFGRAYRERLRGQWGVVDVDDPVQLGEQQ